MCEYLKDYTSYIRFPFQQNRTKRNKKKRVVKIFKPIKYTVEEERGFIVIALVLKRITGGNSNRSDYDNLMRCFFLPRDIYMCYIKQLTM